MEPGYKVLIGFIAYYAVAIGFGIYVAYHPLTKARRESEGFAELFGIFVIFVSGFWPFTALFIIRAHIRALHYPEKYGLRPCDVCGRLATMEGEMLDISPPVTTYRCKRHAY